MAKTPTVTNQQFALFGIIVSQYARVEHGFREALWTMLHIPGELGLIAFAPYSTIHLRNVVASVAKIVLHDDPVLLAELIRLLGVQKSLDKLRNDIAHNLWAAGSGPDTISVLHTSVREGKAEFVGFNKSPREYGTKELEAAANKAVQLNTEMIAYLDSPAWADAMARKTDLASLEIDSILGISTKPSSSPPDETQA